MKERISQASKKTQKVLNDRGETYGTDAATKVSEILKILLPHGVHPNHYKRMAFVTQIVTKLVRYCHSFKCLADKDVHKDSVLDISGYATLLLAHETHEEDAANGD